MQLLKLLGCNGAELGADWFAVTAPEMVAEGGAICRACEVARVRFSSVTHRLSVTIRLLSVRYTTTIRPHKVPLEEFPAIFARYYSWADLNVQPNGPRHSTFQNTQISVHVWAARSSPSHLARPHHDRGRLDVQARI